MVEFLLMFSFVIAIFTIAFGLYANWIDEANQLRNSAEATRICLQLANHIDSMATMTGNSTNLLALPDQIYYQNYSIYVASSNRIVKVDYGTGGIGCNILTNRITNSSGAILFMVQNNATISATDGVLVVQ